MSGRVGLADWCRRANRPTRADTLPRRQGHPRGFAIISASPQPRVTASFALFAVLLCCMAAHAAPIDLWFQSANRFYEQKQYDSAAVYYEKITNAGVASSAVYFNLGNTCFRLNRVGQAILYYEKAGKLDPSDPDIQSNLRFANLNIVDKVPQAQRGFFGTILWRLHTALPLGVQLWVLLGLLFALSLSASAAFFASHNVRLWMIYLSSIVGLGAALLGASVGVKVYAEENAVYAIVLTPAIDARNQPDGPKVQFTAHEGTKFRIHRTVNDWAFVSLPNGLAGWVNRSALGRI